MDGEKNVREKLHGIGVDLDALLPVLGEISQHLQRLLTYGYAVFIRPDLHGNEHHSRVQLFFEDLSLKRGANASNK